MAWGRRVGDYVPLDAKGAYWRAWSDVSSPVPYSDHTVLNRWDERGLLKDMPREPLAPGDALLVNVSSWKVHVHSVADYLNGVAAKQAHWLQTSGAARAATARVGWARKSHQRREAARYANAARGNGTAGELVQAADAGAPPLNFTDSHSPAPLPPTTPTADPGTTTRRR